MKPAPRKVLLLLALVIIGTAPVHAVQDRPAAELEYDKALAAITSGSYGDAVEMLDSLVDEQPYNASYLFDLARARVLNEDLDRAVDTFKTLLQLDPNHKPAAVALAQIHDRRGEWPDASAAAARPRPPRKRANLKKRTKKASRTRTTMTRRD